MMTHEPANVKKKLLKHSTQYTY